MEEKMVLGRNRLLLWVSWGLFGCSFALLAFYQIVRYVDIFILATVALAWLTGFLLIRYTGEDVLTYVRKRRLLSAALLLAALVIVVAMKRRKSVAGIVTILPAPPQELTFQLFRLRWWLLTVPAVFYLLLWVWRSGSGLILELWKGMDSWERRVYLGAAAIAFAVILAAYTVQPQWYLQYDSVYSIDSGWCFEEIFPQISYYDIRHPVLSVFTFPIWALIHAVHTAMRFLAPLAAFDTLCAALLQTVNAQALLLTGVMVGRMAQNRWVLLFYLFSAPTLLFILFFEKYQIALFLLVAYAYRLCRGEEQEESSLILAMGAMPTNGFLYLSRLLRREPLFRKVGNILYTVVWGVAFLVCTGRVHLLNPRTLLGEAGGMASAFGLQGLSLKECFFSLTNMVHGILVCPPSVVGERGYFWTDLLSRPSVLGLAVIALMALGALSTRRDRFTGLCLVWSGAAVILLCGMQWGIGESPLFSVYFSWAMLPLFQRGVQVLIDKLRWREEAVYLPILAVMLGANLFSLSRIETFLETL